MNIYITQENEKWLREQDKSMSGIINALIAMKRGLTVVDAVAEINSRPTPRKVESEKVPYAFTEFEGALINRTTERPKGVCKIHGVPLTGDGKCLQKGCKYA
jgi:hypothetical protein